jgi:hypothetical protein
VTILINNAGASAKADLLALSAPLEVLYPQLAQ